MKQQAPLIPQVGQKLSVQEKEHIIKLSPCQPSKSDLMATIVKYGADIVRKKFFFFHPDNLKRRWVSYTPRAGMLSFVYHVFCSSESKIGQCVYNERVLKLELTKKMPWYSKTRRLKCISERSPCSSNFFCRTKRLLNALLNSRRQKQLVAK